MRHRIFGRKLHRSKNQRKALFKSLVYELVMHGRVKTTQAKAKAVKPLVDKLVTKAKSATLSSHREILRILPKDGAGMLFDSIVPRFAGRSSGFSRIIQLGERLGDNAPLVLLEWSKEPQALTIKDDHKRPAKRARGQKRKAEIKETQKEKEKPVRRAKKKSV